MENLPAGWSVSNSSGSWTAPAYQNEDDDVLQGEDGLEAEDLRPDSPGWEDMEDDTEEISLKCLLCDEKFNAVRVMVDHCKQSHSFDLDVIRKANSKWRSARTLYDRHILTTECRDRLLQHDEAGQLHPQCKLSTGLHEPGIMGR